MRGTLNTLVMLAALGCCACADPSFTSYDGGARADADGAGPGPSDLTVPCTVDSDDDTIADCHEGTKDSDGDGTADYLDSDADGDGIADREEAGDEALGTPPRDTDGDLIPDYLDLDSDNDGLPDAEELQRGSSPLLVDSDGDRLPDVAEVAIGTDPADPQSTIAPDDYFVILPHNAPKHELRDLEFGTKVQRADVYFLVDTSTTMSGEISNIRASLKSTIVPGVAAEIPDVAMGVGHFEDLPVAPYGTDEFHAFRNLQSLTFDVALVQGALDQLATCCFPDGSTMPESQVVALWCTATGQGLGSFVPAAAACPATTYGYPCFRPQALPIVLMITDAPFHNGPGGAASYDASIQPAPPSYAQAVAALQQARTKVVGVFSGAFGEEGDLTSVVRDSGAVDAAGNPLVLTINEDGTGLGPTVVQAVKQMAGTVPRDVDTATEETPQVADGVDATAFIKGIRPKAAAPPNGVLSMDQTTFYRVMPGTRVLFEVDFYNDVAPPAAEDRSYAAQIVVRGDKSVLLDTRRVVVIVPRQGSSLVID